MVYRADEIVVVRTIFTFMYYVALLQALSKPDPPAFQAGDFVKSVSATSTVLYN